MRIHENYRIANSRGQLVPAWRLLAQTRIDTPLVFRRTRWMWGEEWRFSGCYLGKGEYLIILTSEVTQTDVEDYTRRWELKRCSRF